MDKKYTWSDLYRDWKYYCNYAFNSGITGRTKTIKAESQWFYPYGLYKNHFDWWPKCELRKRGKDKAKQNIICYCTRPGLLSTAYLLSEYKNNIEKQHAIYILASLWSMKKNLPEKWRGKTYSMLNDMTSLVIYKHNDIYSWHSGCKETLPINILDYPGYDIFTPKNEFEIMYLVSLETALVYANWQTVEYVEIKT